VSISSAASRITLNVPIRVDRDRLAEQVKRERALLADDLGRGADAGAVHHDPQVVAAPGDAGQGRADGGGVGHVGRGERDRRAQPLRYRLALGVGQVKDGHLRAGGGEPLDRRQAEPGGAAGDECRSPVNLHVARFLTLVMGVSLAAG
jgi:hypothetical protein